MKIKTHRFIINKSIDKLDIDLFKKNRKYILRGARKADYSLSHLCLGSFNHFYNPKMNRGFLFFLSNAKEKGKVFFERAVENYKKGKIKKSMIQLGIALHLIADSAVPCHAKNKIHIPKVIIPLIEDKLECFINKNLIIAEMCLENIKATIRNSIEDYFEELSKAAYEYKLKRMGLFAFLSIIFGKKMHREELVRQTKEIVPLSISCTMGAMKVFYEKANNRN